MVVLVPGQALTVPSPELLVENRLAAGQVRFQLVVIDDAGTESAPAEIVITVTAPVVQPVPTPVEATATTTRATVGTVLQRPGAVKLPPGLAGHIFTPRIP